MSPLKEDYNIFILEYEVEEIEEIPEMELKN